MPEPFIPETVTVHLGRPNDASAENVTVSFPDYIKNVASSELYPTWPEAALRANIYAIISFTLNRIFTEWNPSLDPVRPVFLQGQRYLRADSSDS